MLGDKLQLAVVPGVRVVAGAPNDDLILLDRDLHGAVTRPVFGVDRVILDGWVQPEAVALLTVVKGRLERSRGPAPPPAATTSAASPAAAGGLLGVVLVLVLVRAVGFGGIELSRDQSIILGAEVDLAVEVSGCPCAFDVVTRSELLLAAEGLDLLHGDLELVRDPGIGPTLSDPGANAVQLWSE